MVHKRDQGTFLPLLVTAAALIVLVIHSRHYLPFLADDALISLRYARRFLEGSGLTWTDGKPVEGYSNLLWIILTSGLGYIGFDLIVSVRILGYLFFSLTIGAVVYSQCTLIKTKSLNSFISPLIIALAAPVAIWTIGGLEQPLVACLLSWSLVLYFPVLRDRNIPFRCILAPSLLMGLLCISRPDGALFTASTVLSLIVITGFTRQTFRNCLKIIIIPVLFYAGQLTFRLLYYGEIVPNSALIKLTPSLHHFSLGITYILKGLIALSPFTTLVLLFVILVLLKKIKIDPAKRSIIIFISVQGCVWSGYVAFIGGDIFPGWRHIIPLVVLSALIIPFSVQWLEMYIEKHSKGLTSLIMIVMLGLFIFLQFSNPKNIRAKEENWEWDGQVIGKMLKTGFGSSQPLLATPVAGCLPYWSELPSVDMLGLNDYYIPRHPVEIVGRGYLGHEFGNGQYILNRQPDLIIFIGPEGGIQAVFPSGKQLQQMDEFFNLYTPVVFEGRDPYVFQSIIWVNRYSSKIGIRKEDSEIILPGFLFSGTEGTVTYLNKKDEFVIEITQSDPVSIRNLALSNGLWKIEIDSITPVSVKALNNEDGAVLADAPSPVEISLEGDELTYFDVILKPVYHDRSVIHEMRIVRK